MSKNTFPGFVINQTTISVDYWPKQNQPNITHYFLTHCHTDHTKNLDSSWNISKIYCSKVTKKLLIDLNEVPEEYIEELEMNKTHIMKLDETESFNVSLIDANHCPGAVMFLFEGYFGVVLATGDFRYDPSMFIETPLKNNQVDVCYLDNTYYNPIFSKTPTRDEGLRQIIEIIEQNRPHNVLFRLILKKLGKEVLLTDLFEYFRIPIVVSTRRFERLTKVLEIDKSYFDTEFKTNSLIFVDDSHFYENNFLIDKRIITIEPTGLQLPNNRKRKSDPTFFTVPYSDHSSYTEIVSFVKKLKPKKLIPIVRKMLPNDIDTTDLGELDKYLDKKPLKDCSQKYSLLLKSTTSTKKSSRLNSYRLNESKQKNSRVPTPINTRFITVRNKISKSVKKQIEYDTPEKGTPKKVDNVSTTPTIPFSSQRRIIQAPAKSQQLHPSKLVNTFLDPIVEENKSDVSCDISHLNENELIDMTNNVLSKKTRRSSIKSSKSKEIVHVEKRKSTRNKENLEGESSNSKWQKIDDNVELLICGDDSMDSDNTLDLSTTNSQSSDIQFLEEKFTVPLPVNVAAKFNAVVRLEKIDVKQYMKKSNLIKTEENVLEEIVVDTESEKVEDSSDESILIENTIEDNIFDENANVSVDSENFLDCEIIEKSTIKKSFHNKSLQNRSIRDKSILDQSLQNKSIHKKSLQNRSIHDKSLQNRSIHDKSIHERSISDNVNHEIEIQIEDQINQNEFIENIDVNTNIENEATENERKRNMTKEEFLDFMDMRLKEFDVNQTELGELINTYILESFHF